MGDTLPSADDVVGYWFDELSPGQWFRKDIELDTEIGQRFFGLHRAAAAGELWQWRRSATGRLAEILVLDQFSRNLFRGLPGSFTQDPMALVLAQEAVAQGQDQELDMSERAFLYMPYMHSESLKIHDEALRLFDQPGLEDNLGFEQRHRDILLRFGRYPHRNAILGRESTDEELAFLMEPGSSF